METEADVTLLGLASLLSPSLASWLQDPRCKNKIFQIWFFPSAVTWRGGREGKADISLTKFMFYRENCQSWLLVWYKNHDLYLYCDCSTSVYSCTVTDSTTGINLYYMEQKSLSYNFINCSLELQAIFLNWCILWKMTYSKNLEWKKSASDLPIKYTLKHEKN